MLEYNKEYKLKDLCNELNISLKSGGKQRTNAISKIKHDYEIEKIGTKYVVLRELSDLEKLEQIKYNKAKEYIEPIMYKMLLNEPENNIVMSIPKLARKLSMVNENYYYCDNIPFDDELEANHYINFLFETQPMVRKIIDNILDDMQERSLVFWHNELWYAKKTTYLNNKKNTKTWKCDNESKFLRAQRNIWDKYGIEKESDIYKKYSFKNGFVPTKIYSTIKAEISKSLDIDFYFYKRNITLNKQGIKERLTQLEYRQLTNDFVYDKFVNSKQGILKEIDIDLLKSYCDFSIRIENIESDFENQNSISNSDFENEM